MKQERATMKMKMTNCNVCETEHPQHPIARRWVGFLLAVVVSWPVMWFGGLLTAASFGLLLTGAEFRMVANFGTGLFAGALAVVGVVVYTSRRDRPQTRDNRFFPKGRWGRILWKERP